MSRRLPALKPRRVIRARDPEIRAVRVAKRVVAAGRLPQPGHQAQDAARDHPAGRTDGRRVHRSALTVLRFVDGIDKFIAYEIPLPLARERYAGHFDVVTRDLHESDDLRILDYKGERAFRLFHLAELGRPILHEPG